MPLSVLVTGVSGYVGGELVPRLLRDGHSVRGFARDATHVPDLGIEVVEGDVSTGEGLDAAMAGMDVACYLIHSMEGGSGDFDEEEAAGARRFVAAGRRAGVRRVVFLGGITPDEDEEGGSEHLESRHAVEEILADGFPEAVALRASMVIGVGSASYDLLASLVDRLPVLALPAWRDRRTRPIDHRDVIEYLARAVGSEAIHGARTFDVGGATETTYGALVEAIAESRTGGRPTIDLPFKATPVASRVAATVSGQDVGLVEPLMQSLEHDLLPDDEAARETFGVDPRSLEEALADAARSAEER